MVAVLIGWLVATGTAMESLSGMQSFLSGRPKCFRSLEHAIEWRCVMGVVRVCHGCVCVCVWCVYVMGVYVCVVCVCHGCACVCVRARMCVVCVHVQNWGPIYTVLNSAAVTSLSACCLLGNKCPYLP